MLRFIIEVLSTVSKIKVTGNDQQYYFRAFEEIRSNLEITLTYLYFHNWYPSGIMTINNHNFLKPI
jgi:hypothetical protein